MPGENIQDWSTTAATNGSADSLINFAEGQPRASVNNSARSMMAAHAKDRNLQNGSIATTGSANVQAFLSGVGYTAVPTGLRVLLRIGIGLTNNGATTLNMDSIGAVTIKDHVGIDLTAGALVENTYAEFLYNSVNWILLSQAPGTLANVRIFTANGTYPTTTSQVKVLVYCKAAGGGGGSSLTAFNGGGGGEGGECWLLTTAAIISAASVLVGAPGTPGASGTAGGTGGPSSVGAAVGTFGGTGGSPGHNGGQGGNGGSGGTFTFGMPGAAGQCGADKTGAVASFHAAGGGKGGGIANNNGVANSGGGGGSGSNSGSAGQGGSGIVVCFEYGVI